eukprot:GHVL01040514.1.p2 GENE.GHVL01040514.1~~GHVL01040514.1.p2  ORF type:complete len:127 (-),score=38.08 GHVL01040514.1:922-1302(-)
MNDTSISNLWYKLDPLGGRLDLRTLDLAEKMKILSEHERGILELFVLKNCEILHQKLSQIPPPLEDLINEPHFITKHEWDHTMYLIFNRNPRRKLDEESVGESDETCSLTEAETATRQLQSMIDRW